MFVEDRAAEPMLPLRLFRSYVFSVCSILSFIVGFAMLGAMTYLPTYLQFVDGVSATGSGFRTLPLVAGLMFTSILSGQIVGRTGRYKIFPSRSVVMAVGLWLMSTMALTGILRESLYMAVMGLGIGLAMQVLTIAVQNTVHYSDLGGHLGRHILPHARQHIRYRDLRHFVHQRPGQHAAQSRSPPRPRPAAPISGRPTELHASPHRAADRPDRRCVRPRHPRRLFLATIPPVGGTALVLSFLFLEGECRCEARRARSTSDLSDGVRHAGGL